MSGKKWQTDFLLIFLILGSIFTLWDSGEAQTKPRRVLSIATGGPGGVFYVIGGGVAQVVSKHLPDTTVSSEATAGSQDNCRLIHAGKAELGLVAVDVGYDALKGSDRFKSTGPIPLRAIAGIFSNYMHFITLEGSGIKSISDLKGKRVSTGQPGSGTEFMCMRLLESYGIRWDKDLKAERLGAMESAGALKDRKIEAFAWSGGLPTAAILDLAATPGIKIRFLKSAETVDKIITKYGPICYKTVMPKDTYAHMDSDVEVLAIRKFLVCHEKMDADLAYNILKVLFENQQEFMAVHREARNFTLANATLDSPFPFHPGAIRYYQEKGIKVKQKM